MSRLVYPGFIALILLMAAPFILSSVAKGFDGLMGAPNFPTRLFHADAPVANISIFSHMIAGAVITGLALLQTMPQVRARWPQVHRMSGRLTLVAAGITGVGGLTYIAAKGTIGGPWMSFGFTLYGVCVLIAAVMTWRTARARAFARHREWGLRMVWLAIGSWLYRVFYGLWVVTMGEVAMAPDFSGAFDRAMVLGFFVPQLILLELYLRRGRAVEPVPSEG
ncbi:MAG: DUF2306 domain-containing protein [Pseudomonadota bacterium]